jgi:hypothetical protein
VFFHDAFLSCGFALRSGTKPTFQYNSFYWTSGATLNENPSQYAAYVANQSEAVFRPFVNMSGVGVRLIMTANGAYASRGTGANLDLPLGNFSSLVSLFSQEPTVYSSPQPGLPAEWWANTFVPSVPNRYVAYTLPLIVNISAWQATVPGPVGTEESCKLQGVNVGELTALLIMLYALLPLQLIVRVASAAANMYRDGALYQGNWIYSSDGGTFGYTLTMQYRLGYVLAEYVIVCMLMKELCFSYITFSSHALNRSIIYNDQTDCISPDSAFGIGGFCLTGPYPATTTTSCFAAGEGYGVPGYFSVWVLSGAPPSCSPGTS